jgi:hypothetical protein
MQPVSGFERPWIQWTFVVIGAVLIAVAAAEAVAIRRARQAMDGVRAAELNARLDRQQFEIQLTHERSAREALALEVARLRGSAAAANAEPPTLTLTPLMKRGAAPPDPSVEQPPPHLPIQLRLLLPRDAPAGLKDFTVTLRNWSTGQALWTRGGVTADTLDRRSVVTAFVTGDVLTAGAYEILLTAGSTAGQPLEIATYELSIAPPKR